MIFLFLIVAPAGGGCQTMDTSRKCSGDLLLGKSGESQNVKNACFGGSGVKNREKTRKKGVFE